MSFIEIEIKPWPNGNIWILYCHNRPNITIWAKILPNFQANMEKKHYLSPFNIQILKALMNTFSTATSIYLSDHFCTTFTNFTLLSFHTYKYSCILPKTCYIITVPANRRSYYSRILILGSRLPHNNK